MRESTLRALEDLLRRVLRAPGHGIEPGAQSLAVHGRVQTRRWRAAAALVTAVAVVAVLAVLGWYARWHGSG